MLTVKDFVRTINLLTWALQTEETPECNIEFFDYVDCPMCKVRIYRNLRTTYHIKCPFCNVNIPCFKKRRRPPTEREKVEREFKPLFDKIKRVDNLRRQLQKETKELQDFRKEIQKEISPPLYKKIYNIIKK